MRRKVAGSDQIRTRSAILLFCKPGDDGTCGHVRKDSVLRELACLRCDTHGGAGTKGCERRRGSPETVFCEKHSGGTSGTGTSSLGARSQCSRRGASLKNASKSGVL